MRSTLWYWIITILGMLTALGLYWFATSKGIGVTPDSISYVWGAQSFLAGKGYRSPTADIDWVPLTLWPPGYSLFLAAWRVLFHGFFEIQRYVHGLLLICSLGLYALFVYESLRGRLFMFGFLIFLYIASPSVLPVYTMAWSEPLYLVLTLISLQMLVQYSRDHKNTYFIASAVIAGMCPMIRYVGLATVATGLVYLTTASDTAKHIVKRISLYAGISLGPFFVWILRDRAVSNTTFGRTLGFYPESIKRLFIEGPSVIGSWVAAAMPKTANGPNTAFSLAGAVSVIVLICLFLIVLKKHRLSTDPHVKISLIYIGIFFLVYFVSVVFIDENAEIDFRSLSPLYPYMLLICVWLLATYTKAFFHDWRRYIIYVLCTTCIGYSFAQVWSWSREAMRVGLGANRWLSLPVVSTVKKRYDQFTIFTNRPKIAYYLFGHLSIDLSECFNDCANMERQFASKHAILIFFPGYGEEYYPSEAELVTRFNLTMVANDGDVNVYEHK